MSLSGRLSPFNKCRERTINSRSRRTLFRFHGRSKRWLDAAMVELQWRSQLGQGPVQH
jgi:hypothetical protein